MSIILKSSNETRVNFKCSHCKCEYTEVEYKTNKVVNTPFYKLYKANCPECGKTNLDNPTLNIFGGFKKNHKNNTSQKLLTNSVAFFNCRGCGYEFQMSTTDCVMRKTERGLIAMSKCECCENIIEGIIK